MGQQKRVPKDAENEKNDKEQQHSIEPRRPDLGDYRARHVNRLVLVGVVGPEECFVVNGTRRMQRNGGSRTVQAKMQMRPTKSRQQRHDAQDGE
jgi:hypothetical protein